MSKKKVKQNAEIARKKEEQKRLKREAAQKKAEIRQKKRAARAAFYGKIRKKFYNSPHGFDYFNYGFLPRVELSVRGDGPSIAARLSSAKITAVDMTKKGALVTFKIRKKDLHKAIAILNEMCYTYKVGSTLGAPKLGLFLLARIGLIAGLAAAVLAVNIAYSYIWRLEITGTERVSPESVQKALYAEGIKSGLKKGDITAGSVASIVERIDGVADASAEIVGTTLRINVLEATDYTVHEKAGAYISDYDATVTRIVMRSGTSRVKRGDLVKKGDCLADGCVYSTSGELLFSGDCDAEVYGNISVTVDAYVSTTAIEYVRTGREKTRTTFNIFGLRLFKAKSPFASYESVSATAHYDVLLPLYVTTTTFYETERVEVERNLDDVIKDYALEVSEEMRLNDFDYSYTIKAAHSGLQKVHLFLSGEALISKGVSSAPVEQQANWKRN